jgi:CheY-like chemotaxis protein
MAPRTLQPVLIVENDPDDLFLIRRLFAKAGVKNPVVTFEDGEDAIQFLRGSCSATGAVLPCLVFTDLKMPRVDGFQLATWIRKQKALRDVVIVMLSGAGEESDVKRAKAIGIDRYLVKLPKPDEIAAIVAAASKQAVR